MGGSREPGTEGRAAARGGGARLCRGREAGRRGLGCWGPGGARWENGEQSGGAPRAQVQTVGVGEGAQTLWDRAGHGVAGGRGKDGGASLCVPNKVSQRARPAAAAEAAVTLLLFSWPGVAELWPPYLPTLPPPSWIIFRGWSVGCAVGVPRVRSQVLLCLPTSFCEVYFARGVPTHLPA